MLSVLELIVSVAQKKTGSDDMDAERAELRPAVVRAGSDAVDAVHLTHEA